MAASADDGWPPRDGRTVCHGKGPSCPMGQCLGIVIESIRHSPVGPQGARTALGCIDERPHTLAFEVRYDLVIGLQIDDVIDNERKHRPIGPDAGAAEHAADRHPPEG